MCKIHRDHNIHSTSCLLSSLNCKVINSYWSLYSVVNVYTITVIFKAVKLCVIRVANFKKTVQLPGRYSHRKLCDSSSRLHYRLEFCCDRQRRKHTNRIPVHPEQSTECHQCVSISSYKEVKIGTLRVCQNVSSNYLSDIPPETRKDIDSIYISINRKLYYLWALWELSI